MMKLIDWRDGGGGQRRNKQLSTNDKISHHNNDETLIISDNINSHNVVRISNDDDSWLQPRKDGSGFHSQRQAVDLVSWRINFDFWLQMRYSSFLPRKHHDLLTRAFFSFRSSPNL